jgi:ADP-ribose pyrophosphatase YjhB (NUDIX family)
MTGKTPRVAVDCVVFDKSGRLLLIRRRNPPFAGQFALPGGFVDYGESTEAAVRRELLEERSASPISPSPTARRRARATTRPTPYSGPTGARSISHSITVRLPATPPACSAANSDNTPRQHVVI